MCLKSEKFEYILRFGKVTFKTPSKIQFNLFSFSSLLKMIQTTLKIGLYYDLI